MIVQNLELCCIKNTIKITGIIVKKYMFSVQHSRWRFQICLIDIDTVVSAFDPSLGTGSPRHFCFTALLNEFLEWYFEYGLKRILGEYANTWIWYFLFKNKTNTIFNNWLIKNHRQRKDIFEEFFYILASDTQKSSVWLNLPICKRRYLKDLFLISHIDIAINIYTLLVLEQSHCTI